MVEKISAEETKALLEGDSQFALIDVREAGEYNSTHIPGSSSIPRRLLEWQMPAAVPFQGVPVILCDDDGRRAELAAATLDQMGYSKVSVLNGGINWWTSLDYPTEWGSNVPSKDFGEKMEVVHQVPEIDATELHQWIEDNKKMVILDTRTPEEHQRFCIPGSRSVPGGELALRITDIAKDLDEDTTVVIHCAGRTRSIIGTRALQRMGVSNIFGLKNGTSGWVLAGYELETGSKLVDLPDPPSPEAQEAAEVYARRLAEEDGVRSLDVPALQAMFGKRGLENIYFIDVRTQEEYEGGHIPGFRWFPGGQVVQRSDDVAVAHNSTVVFSCDRWARATFAGSWYRQMGFQEVYAVSGGTGAWQAAGLDLEKGIPEEAPQGLAAARAKVTVVTSNELHASPSQFTIFVDTSQDFSKGHIPGARWVPRGWLELQIENLVPEKNGTVAVTSNDGSNAVLAGATLKELGYTNVSALDGGMAAWRQQGLPIENGLTGVMAPPTDLVLSGPDRNYADMMTYLRWETALGEKYER